MVLAATAALRPCRLLVVLAVAFCLTETSRATFLPSPGKIIARTELVVRGEAESVVGDDGTTAEPPPPGLGTAYRMSGEGTAGSPRAHLTTGRRLMATVSAPSFASFNDGYSKWRDAGEVKARMRRVCNATPRHARNCRITRITNATSDGADMEALLIGANANAGGVEAVGGSTVVGPWVFVMAGQHAREWLPIMAAVFLAERLLEGMATARAVPELASPDVRQLAELLTRITVVIIPITNIDGFKYTYSRQGTAGGLSCSVRDTVKRKCLRLWRKSRSAMPVHTRIGLGGDCSGVDLNRNWPVDWGHLRGGKRASPDPCNDEYAGTAPFSAPETRAIRDFILAVSQPPMAALDIHAFAQAVLGPWSHSNGDPIGAGRIDRIGEAVAAAMSGVHGAQHVYGRGTADDLIYLASGTFVDWMFVMHRIPAYTVELRPRAGRFSGFDLGTANIILAGDEITVGVLALMYTALQELEMSSASTSFSFSSDDHLFFKQRTCPYLEGNQTLTRSVTTHLPWVVKLALGYDWYPDETSWDLWRLGSGGSESSSSGPSESSPVLSSDEAHDGGSLQAHCGSTHVFMLCTSGVYTFTLRDSRGDGLCCEHGKGTASLWIDDVKVWSAAETRGATSLGTEQTFRFTVVDDGRRSTTPRIAAPIGEDIDGMGVDTGAGGSGKNASENRAPYLGDAAHSVKEGNSDRNTSAGGTKDLDLNGGDSGPLLNSDMILGFALAVGVTILTCCTCWYYRSSRRVRSDTDGGGCYIFRSCDSTSSNNDDPSVMRLASASRRKLLLAPVLADRVRSISVTPTQSVMELKATKSKATKSSGRDDVTDDDETARARVGSPVDEEAGASGGVYARSAVAAKVAANEESCGGVNLAVGSAIENLRGRL